MTKVQENQKTSGTYSKFWRITLVLISVVLVFAGPTYVPYLMSKVQIGAFASAVAGGVLFILGIGMIWFLVNKKILT